VVLPVERQVIAEPDLDLSFAVNAYRVCSGVVDHELFQ
jgi:hypothetical protein